MNGNIVPKYIERAPRRSGKSTRLLWALKDFRGMVFYEKPVVVVSPNPHMSQELKRSFISTLTHFTTNPRGYVREERVRSVDPARDILFTSAQSIRGINFGSSNYFFFDEVNHIDFQISDEILNRTVYVAYTSTGNDSFNLSELIRLNGGLGYVY